MRTGRWLWIVGCWALLAGCRGSNVSNGPAEPSRSANAGSSASTPQSAAPAPASPSSTTGSSLPKLKPISSKPFPEGVREATVCEAIDSKEPDVWVRFGHLVPAYVTGAVYVLETGPENKDKLFKYIQSNYVYGYYSQQASCRGNLTLLYIRMMYDESEYNGKPFGRMHLSQAIERKLGIKTRESLQLENDERRLAAYCRAGAELCDQLLKVDRANRGEGICAFAVVSCFQRNRNRPGLMEACKALPTSAFSCLKFALGRDEQYRCSDSVVSVLCPAD